MSDRNDVIRAAFPLVNGHPDVAGLLRDRQVLALLGPALADPYRDAGVTAVCAPEARGPILGALVAVELGVGLVIVRKSGRNHPGADRMRVSGPTWRGHPEEFQARSFDFTPSDRVLVVDDWVTSGSTIRTAREFVEEAGATFVGTSALVDKADDATRAELRLHALVRFDDLVGH